MTVFLSLSIARTVMSIASFTRAVVGAVISNPTIPPVVAHMAVSTGMMREERNILAIARERIFLKSVFIKNVC